MRLSFSSLKEKLDRKFSFISAIESESDFYLELIDYLVLLLSDTRLSYIVGMITQDGERAKEKFNMVRKQTVDLLLKTRNNLQELLTKNGIKEDDAKNLFQHFDGLFSGKISTSAIFEEALEREIYTVIYKIVKDYPDIPLDKIAKPRDEIGNWIVLSPLKEAIENCREARSYHDLEKKHAVWGAWERLALIPRALYTTSKEIHETFEENAVLAMGLSALSSEIKNIVSKGVFRQNNSCRFSRETALLDLTRIHNFVLDNIEKSNLGFGILTRYKQRCEWFDKEQLLSLIENKGTERKKIEAKLTREMSKYLHDNGIIPLSEVVFGRSRPDLLGLYSGEELFPIEVKVIESNEIGRLKTGFNQILTYIETIDVLEGFYVVYCVGDFILDIPSSIFRNERRINIIKINLFRTPPSKRKPNVKTVTNEDLTN
jgi:hypothetical protein